MGIDTREKRQAVSVISTYFSPTTTPNATKDQEWRQETAWSYPGILAGGAGPASGFWCALTGQSGYTGGGRIRQI